MPSRSKIAVVSFKDVGERVRAARLLRGATQVQLAKLLGTAQGAISEVESGKRGLSVQQVVKVARALGTTPNEILGEQRSDASEPTMDRRFLRRIQRIEKLPRSDKQALLKTIDAFLLKVS